MSALFTRETLMTAKACSDQVTLFDQNFPKGSVNVTVARAKKLAAVFDWDWAARFLDAPAWDDYARIEADARANYRRIRASAGADYERIKEAAIADYRRITAPAWAQGYIETCKKRKAAA